MGKNSSNTLYNNIVAVTSAQKELKLATFIDGGDVSAPDAATASSWCTIIKIPSNELYQNIVTSRWVNCSLVLTKTHF